jgi:type 1 glutamine amidotransferase
VKAIRELGKQHDFTVDTTESSESFSEKNLKNYNVIVFLNTTGDVLNEAQQLEMNRWIQAGGGFVGIHAAADTEYDWPWYGRLVGAWFHSHPKGLQTTVVRFEGDEAALARDWQTTDELYNYRSNPRADVNVIATVDESRYQGGTMGADHPIAWCSNRLGGRAWYTGLGHTDAQYADAVFRAHLLRGLRYAIGRANAC